MKELRSKTPGLRIPEIAKQIGRLWADLSMNQREKYQVLAVKDRERFDHQKKQFQKLGFFLMPDGTRSTDTPPEKN